MTALRKVRFTAASIAPALLVEESSTPDGSSTMDHVGARPPLFHRRYDGDPVGHAGVRERLFGDLGGRASCSTVSSRESGSAWATSTVE